MSKQGTTARAPAILQQAAQHVEARDSLMARLLLTVIELDLLTNFPVPTTPDHYFSHICRSIIGQQISTKAALSIFNRFSEALSYNITPEQFLSLSPDTVRSAGVSPQKISYLTYNATHWITLPIDTFIYMSDEDIIQTLIKLHGIGRWTAEMFLIFTMGRPDVFSRGDLGLMQSTYHYYDFKPHYSRKIQTAIESWSPYRSVAALTLWAARDNHVPKQSVIEHCPHTVDQHV